MKISFIEFLIWGTVLLLVSCNSEKNKTPENVIKQYFISNVNDPKSYEPIETKCIDSFYLINNLKTRISQQEFLLVTDSNSLKGIIETMNFYQGMDKKYGGYSENLNAMKKPFDEKQTSIDENLKRIQELNHRLDSLQKNNINPIVSRKYYHKLRAKNGFGALALSEWVIYLNDTLGVITHYSADQDDKESLRVPGGY